MKNFCVIIAIADFLNIIFAMMPLSAISSEVPKAQQPAVITSLGQSPDSYAASVLAKRAGLKIDYSPLLPAGEVSKYKTLIMAVGASLKGFGSAGVNLDTELKRGNEIVKAAKENKVFFVILHSGGEGRREQMSNRLLDSVARKGDFLLVLEDSNKDDYFTKIAQESKIPILLFEHVLKIQEIFKQMFAE